MEKALIYIISGENDRMRAIMGLNVARRAHEFKRFSEVKVIIQGPQERLIFDEDPKVKETVDYLISNHVMDSACAFFAESLSIEEPIKARGVELKPSGERMAQLVNDGFIPISF